MHVLFLILILSFVPTLLGDYNFKLNVFILKPKLKYITLRCKFLWILFSQLRSREGGMEELIQWILLSWNYFLIIILVGTSGENKFHGNHAIMPESSSAWFTRLHSWPLGIILCLYSSPPFFIWESPTVQYTHFSCYYYKLNFN